MFNDVTKTSRVGAAGRLDLKTLSSNKELIKIKIDKITFESLEISVFVTSL